MMGPSQMKQQTNHQQVRLLEDPRLCRRPMLREKCHHRHHQLIHPKQAGLQVICRELLRHLSPRRESLPLIFELKTLPSMIHSATMDSSSRLLHLLRRLLAADRQQFSHQLRNEKKKTCMGHLPPPLLRWHNRLLRGTCHRLLRLSHHSTHHQPNSHASPLMFIVLSLQVEDQWSNPVPQPIQGS